MFDALPRSAELDRLLDAAEALSGLPLREIASAGPAHELQSTRAAQPLLYIADWAWASALARAGVRPAAVAGHSLGELAALAFAGVFSVEAGLELVCERARLMSVAGESQPGGMAAVLGMDRDEVADLLDGLSGVWFANDNAPGQVVIAGTHAGLDAATHALSEAGARRIVPLDVSGPFHSPLVSSAAEGFAEILSRAVFEDARIPVVQNAAPAPAVDAETIRSRLIAQMTAPVRWVETVHSLAAMGIDTLIETGPGAVLSGLARRIGGMESLAAEAVGIDGVLEVIRT
jgi:[acyl-carrier-protein] S-malonyltransferase